MSAITISSKKFEDGMFPDDTRIYIEWVAQQKILRSRIFGKNGRKMYKERRRVWKGIVSGQVTRNFDPGKYMYKAHKEVPGAFDNFSEVGEFLVDMTEDQWAKVSHMQPRMQNARMTTDGVIFTCQFPGCGKNTTSKISSLLHETWEHYGINLLDEPDRKDEVDEQMKQMSAQIAEKKRGPGRPPKNRPVA